MKLTMIQEDKELLLKDLCARLLYGAMVSAQYKDGEGWKTEDRKLLGLYEDGQVYLDCVYTTIDCVKPYLRPMSSMTEEEAMEYANCGNIIANSPQNNYLIPNPNCVDWLNRHHFDYRGLIEKGLAIEAQKGIY